MRRNVHLKSLLNFLISVLLLCVPSIGYGVDQVVTGPGIDTTQKTLAPGDTLTVTITGDLEVNTIPAAVIMQGNNAVTNNGKIGSTGGVKDLEASAGALGPMSIFNNGILTTNNSATIAIDLNNVTTNVVSVTNTGEITGKIRLPGLVNSTVLIDGGTITGDIFKEAGIGVSTIDINDDFTTGGNIGNDSGTSKAVNTINVQNAGTVFTVNATVEFSTAFNINAGTETDFVSGADVIGNQPLTNNGTVTVSGTARLSTLPNNAGTWSMTGGTVSGATFTNSGSLTLSGGSISNTLFTNSGSLTVNGGTLSGTTLNNTGSTILSAGAITSNTFNNNGGSLTLNGGSMTNSTALTNSGTVTINGGSISSAAATNTGTISIAALPNVGLAVTNNYTQNSGTLTSSLLNTSNFGRVTAGGTANLTGSTLGVTLADGVGAQISDGNTFNVVSATGGITGGPSTFTAPNTSLLFFTLSQSANNLIVTAHRPPLSAVNNNPAFNSLAAVLDQLRGNPAFNTIFNGLNQLTTIGELEAALAGLSPITNGGIIATSFNVQDLTLNRIFGRIDYRRHKLDYLRLTKAEIAENTGNSGYSAGDMDDGKNSYGPFMFVNNMKQSTRNGFNGYNAWTGGLGIVADAALSKQFTIGGAFTYAASDIIQAGGVKNKNVINSYQVTLYATGEAYCILFGDIMYNIGQNNYRSWRYIPFLGSQQATANFKGTQKGGRLRGGYTIPAFGIEFAPMAYVQYFSLNIPGYVESGGPPGAALAVNAQTANLTRYAVGGRVCNPSEANEFLPELHVFYTYDSQSPNFAVTSQFVAGGGAFTTPGPVPPKSGVNVGASITALINPNLLVKGSFDFEAKKGYISDNFLLEFKYLWL